LADAKEGFSIGSELTRKRGQLGRANHVEPVRIVRAELIARIEHSVTVYVESFRLIGDRGFVWGRLLGARWRGRRSCWGLWSCWCARRLLRLLDCADLLSDFPHLFLEPGQFIFELLYFLGLRENRRCQKEEKRD